MTMWVRIALAGLAGAAMALAFPPFGASVLAPAAVALFSYALWGQSLRVGALVGAIAGLVFFAILLRWLTLVGSDAWIALTVFCAAWFAVLGAVSALVSRLRFAPVWMAAAWVAQEALRDRIPLGGFPWGRLAFAQTATTLTPWAAIGGAALVTFLTALAGTLLAAIAVRARDKARRPVAVMAAALVVLALSGLALPQATDGQEGNGPANSVAAVIQGGALATGLDFADERRDVLNRHVRATEQLAQAVASGDVPRPRFVIWPENSTDIDPLVDPEAAEQISRAANTVGVPILVGAVIGVSPTTVANVGIVWNPGSGPGQMYVKQRPVPFGEYVPFRPLLTRIIGRFDQVPRDFIAGEGSGVLQVGDALIGDVICFEVAYDDVVRNAVRDGGRILAVQTNNATFAGLGQPEQQVAMSRLRAVETGRTVLVAATTGISAIIDPAGRLVAEMGEGESGWLVSEVVLRDSLTLSVRLGELPEWLLSATALVAIIWAVTGHRRRIGLPGEPRDQAADVGSPP
jgi:apolipoprotein N-acyltransferase